MTTHSASEESDPSNRIWLSICTTCANRAHQLRRTFAHNIRVLSKHPDVEWILLNFGSTDNLDGMIEESLPNITANFRYARLRTPRPWHASIAKNAAHRLGRGECLFNLDCDNFIADAIDVVRRYWNRGARAMHLWSGIYGDGSCGRIALGKDVFMRAGGYDEAFLPMGFQDRDLILRVSSLGLPVLHAASPSDVAVKNDKRASVALCAPHATWKDYDERNMLLSRLNRSGGKLVANTGGPWGEVSNTVVSAEVFHPGRANGNLHAARKLKTVDRNISPTLL